MYSDLLEASKKTGVPVKKVLDMFWYLSKKKAIENNELIQKVGVSKNALNQVKKFLSSYLKPSSKETSLQENKIKKINSLYCTHYLTEDDLLQILTGSKIYKQSVELLSQFKDKQPPPKREYDQFTATLETTAKRVALLDFLGDVRDKRILFLGDDDFTSVATANIKSAQNITVVDIDKRILDNIGATSAKVSFEIRRIRHDLRKPIPLDLKDKFDTVFTDPPYTPTGIKLFVSRAIEALDRKNQTARVYVCYGNSDRAKERFLPIQEAITNSGLMLRWLFDRFNRYSGAESVGNASSLYIAEITPRTKPLIKGNYDKPIYTID